MLRALAALLSLGLLSACATPSGVGDSLGLSPHWDWKTLETEHFRLTFPAELKDVARKSAFHLEEAHALLSPLLNWTPALRTQVLVIDNEDSANGLTTPTGRFGIVFYATPPDNWFSTAYYDDWLRLLAIHEYTHFLNMDVTTDYAALIRPVFGDVLLPNSLWPGWMLEGLAVYMETRFTTAGRGRSPFYRMMLRAAVESGVLDKPEFITLDRLGGPNPYYPGGETSYLFGYYLMNQVGDAQALGEMSYRSGGRLPYFIGGNLENLTQKTWPDYWEEWVSSTRTQATKELEQLRSKPLTSVAPLTQAGRQSLGSAFSPDGRFVAYTQDTSEQSMALWLIDRSAPEPSTPRVLTEKILGSSIAFTPDSKSIFFSSLNRITNYTIHSDLAAYHLDSGRTEWLTHGLRARDPDLSRNGQWVTFTVLQESTTLIALAPVEKTDDGYRLGPHRIVHVPSQYDQVSTPKFSWDGKEIVFSLHRNGSASEEVISVEIESGKSRELVKNGKFNRFPTVHPDGSVYFVSDLSGVDNVYRISATKGASGAPTPNPTAVTNVTTGVSFPSFDREGNLHFNLFSHTGWNLVKALNAETRNPDRAASAPVLSEVQAPRNTDPAPKPTPQATEAPIQDYSIFPSIWPRQWSPLLFASGNGLIVGGEIVGFDAIDRHRYLGLVDYDTRSGRFDTFLVYANRSLGPTITLSAQNTTSASYARSDYSLLGFDRLAKYRADLAIPVRWTRSAMSYGITYNFEQTTYWGAVNSPEAFAIYGQSRAASSVDLYLSFSNPEGSALALGPESGRSAAIATRYYPTFGSLSGSAPVFKTYLRDTEYLSLGSHTVLSPSFKASWVNQESNYLPAYVNLQGRSPGNVFSPFTNDSLDHLVVRGYPGRTFYSKETGLFSLDYKFPIFRIYRGWLTHPAFLENLYGVTFAEVAYFPEQESGPASVASAGGGIRLSGDFLVRVPTEFSVEYHQGFNASVGGAGELFFRLGVSGLSF